MKVRSWQFAKWGAQKWNGGPGTPCPPPLATGLVGVCVWCVRAHGMCVCVCVCVCDMYVSPGKWPQVWYPGWLHCSRREVTTCLVYPRPPIAPTAADRAWVLLIKLRGPFVRLVGRYCLPFCGCLAWFVGAVKFVREGRCIIVGPLIKQIIICLITHPHYTSKSHNYYMYGGHYG